jgi:hypothetical protein
MLLNKIVVSILILFFFNACSTKSYENFKKNNDFSIGNSAKYIQSSEVMSYDDKHYIYLYKNIPKGCTYGLITKKDDLNQIIINWKIISGKEFCIEERRVSFSF